MKIIQSAAFYKPHPGGQETYVQGLARALADRGHEVEVVTHDTEGVGREEKEGDVRVVRYEPLMRYYKALLSPRLLSHLRQATKSADVVHLHIPYPLGLEASLLGSGDAALVATFHGEGLLHDTPTYTVPRKAYAWWEKRALTRVDQAVFLSRSYRDSLSLPNSLLERTSVIPSATDTDRFHPGDRDTSSGLEQILFVGNLSKSNRYKGVDNLLRAVAEMDEDLRPAVRVVGRGGLVEEYRRLSKSLGIQAEFRTDVSDQELPAIYQEADLFVLPSLHGPENAPIVLMEAMASGTPVLASELAGIDEMVQDGKTGRLVEPGNVQELVDALVGLAEAPGELKRMGREARAYAVETHSWPVAAQRYEALFERLSG